MDNTVVVKKGNRFWKVVGILLAITAVCFVAVKVYNKYFRKKNEELAEGEELPELDVALDEEETFEVPAEAVIANAADMEVAEEI